MNEKVELEIHSNVQWGIFARTGDNRYDFPYEARCSVKYTYDSGEVINVILTYCGIDAVTLDDNFIGGFGRGSQQDEDGDLAYVDIEWPSDDSKGQLTINGGTGKWAGATGVIYLDVQSRDCPDYEFPLKKPVKVTAIVHGSGQMTKPN